MRGRIAFAAAVLCLAGLLVACAETAGPTTAPAPTANMLRDAAVEATRLVQEAQATAIVLEAQLQATALVEQARLAGGTPTSAVPTPASYTTPTAPSGTPEASHQLDEGVVEEVIPVEITRVSFAAEGGMIMVSFMASPEDAEKWWPGNVSVTDEENGAVYNEIPVLPKIGPIIGRPKVAGQPGYVMLINAAPFLQPGATVTVVLGAHTFEHVPVQ